MSGSSRRAALLAGLAVVVAVAVVVAITRWPSGGASPAPPAVSAASSPSPSPVSSLTGSAAVTRAGGGSVALPDGTQVTIPPLGVSEDTEITVSAGLAEAPSSPPPAGVLLPGAPVRIELGQGSLTKPATVKIPVTVPNDWPSDLPYQPWLASFDEERGEWVPEDSTYDAQRGFVEARVLHFSWWNPMSWDYRAIADSMQQSLADMAGIPSGIPPDCPAPPAEDSIMITIEGEPVVDHCLDTVADATFLRMRGVKHYPLLVTWSGRAELAERTEYELDVSSLYRWLTDQLGLTAVDSVVLPAGGDAHLVVSPDSRGPVLATATYDPQLQLVTIVDATTRVILAVRSATGIDPTAEQVWSVIQDSGCFVQHVDDLATDLPGASVTLIAECAGDVLRALSKDSPKLLLRVLGAAPKIIAAFVGVVLYAGHAVLAEVFTAQDLVTGRTTEKLTITAPGAPGATPSEEPEAGEAGQWPTQAQDGPGPLWIWFGANFVFPSWVSCEDSGRWCIAAWDDEVHIIALDDLRDIGSVPLADTDPQAALTEKGLPPDSVQSLLRPRS